MKLAFILVTCSVLVLPSVEGLAKSGKTLEARITGYSCGDNCWIELETADKRHLSALCRADPCGEWEPGVVPPRYLGRTVRVTIGKRMAYDGDGHPMGRAEAVTSIDLVGGSPAKAGSKASCRPGENRCLEASIPQWEGQPRLVARSKGRVVTIEALDADGAPIARATVRKVWGALFHLEWMTWAQMEADAGSFSGDGKARAVALRQKHPLGLVYLVAEHDNPAGGCCPTTTTMLVSFEGRALKVDVVAETTD